jgi:AcrR family transcriptional regulator
MSADPQSPEPSKPSRTRKQRRFASPRGGDVDPKGARVVQYYNPSPGVVAKRQRIKRVAARLFAERGLAAVGLTQVSHAMNLPSGSVKYYFRNRDDVLADILADHEVALSQRVGAAYDATATAGPVARLAALVEAFYRSVLAAADAHRALLFSTALLPAEPQAWVRARYRALLDSFAETLAELAPEVPAGAVADILVPTLERLLSGVVLWNVPGEHDADPHYPRMVTAMMVAATRTITEEALAERAKRPGPGWLAELAPAGVPAKSGRSFVARATESSAVRTERPEAVEAPRWIANKDARKTFGELLAAAGAGARFVITCHGWPVAHLGPAPSEAVTTPPG